MEKKTPAMRDHGYDILTTYASRPRNWWIYTFILLAVCAILGWSGSAVSFKGMAAKGIEIARGVGMGLIHPDGDLLFNLTPEGVPYQLLQTVAIAVLGTIIGGILAIPFSFLACERIVPKWVAVIARAGILMIRTIPSLVWALMWIRVTGPNAFCGVVTQSICSIGMICKMYITAIEDVDRRVLESLDAMGCNGFQKIRFGVLPQIIPNFISTVIYRFDINVKDATTLGIVGAGGIGAALIQCMNASRWSMVGAYLLGLIVLMILIEMFSTKVRAKLARG